MIRTVYNDFGPKSMQWLLYESVHLTTWGWWWRTAWDKYCARAQSILFRLLIHDISWINRVELNRIILAIQQYPFIKLLSFIIQTATEITKLFTSSCHTSHEVRVLYWSIWHECWDLCESPQLFHAFSIRGSCEKQYNDNTIIIAMDRRNHIFVCSSQCMPTQYAFWYSKLNASSAQNVAMHTKWWHTLQRSINLWRHFIFDNEKIGMDTILQHTFKRLPNTTLNVRVKT